MPVSLGTAVETYIKLKSDVRGQTFFQTYSRAMDYLEQLTSVEDIGHLSQRAATVF